jgi:hypothetical protein
MEYTQDLNKLKKDFCRWLSANSHEVKGTINIYSSVSNRKRYSCSDFAKSLFYSSAEHARFKAKTIDSNQYYAMKGLMRADFDRIGRVVADAYRCRHIFKE